MKGKLIVLEGIDNSGKTTQIRLLTSFLRARGRTVRHMREPGGTAIGEKIRKILLDRDNTRMTVHTELFLYMASRAQLVHEKISPALKQGAIVLCDRYLFSSVAYQGAAGGMGIPTVLNIGKIAVGEAWPDLTIILDLPARIAAGRADSPPDRVEAKGVRFQQNVRKGFRAIARTLGTSALLIDADQPPETVQRLIRQAVAHVV